LEDEGGEIGKRGWRDWKIGEMGRQEGRWEDRRGDGKTGEEMGRQGRGTGKNTIDLKRVPHGTHPS